ncbi:MAG: hypothetical protein R3199_05095 [Gemmatimonadota bacterium]|nr:hypothetical protein [Gemmatimonadota bacterium]
MAIPRLLPALLVAPVLLAASPRAARAQLAPSEAIARGDSLMAELETRKAIDAYRAGLERDSTNVGLLWKTARAASNLADWTPGEEGDETRYDEAVRLARRAVEHGPDISRAHSTLAIALGKLALFRGGKRKVELSRGVKRHAERAIELDPADFSPFTVLGAWHREVATLNFFLKTFAETFYGGLPDASLERSARLLRRAVELAPDTITPRLQLARTYVEMDREAAAREQLRRAVSLEPEERLDVAQKRRARELLEELS